MADDSDQESRRPGKFFQNQPYDESLEIPDSEEVASQYTPTPRVEIRKADRGRRTGETPPKTSMSDDSEDEIETGSNPMQRGGRGQPPELMKDEKMQPLSMPPKVSKPSNDDDDESGSDDEEDDDDDDESNSVIEGAYNPGDYDNLAVSAEIKELFQYITRYTPQSIELEHRLRPFIPDYIPAVGDIDAFIKIPRHDGKTDSLGLIVLDEPCAKQSDPTVLDLMLRSVSKQSNLTKASVKSIENASENSRQIEAWIKSIGDLHRTKPPPNVHYSKNMPDIDTLMQEWPPEFEEVLKEVSLPSSEMECELPQFVDIVCGILDIPVYKSRVQSLHLLFTLFSEFKNSQHFQTRLDGSTKNFSSEPDRLQF